MTAFDALCFVVGMVSSTFIALQIDFAFHHWLHRRECWVEKLTDDQRAAFDRELKKLHAKYKGEGQGGPKVRRPRKAKQESLPLSAVVS